MPRPDAAPVQAPATAPEDVPGQAPALLLAPVDRAELLALLRTHVPGAQVWAYGSRVTGQAHEGSDLDLVLRHPADLRRPTPGLADLREALQDSRLPMLVDVHDWAELPPAFHDEIEAYHLELM